MIAAPTTTKKMQDRIGRKQFVVLEQGESGATEKCVIQLDLITTYRFSDINTTHSWPLSPDRQAEVSEAIRYVFSLQ